MSFSLDERKTFRHYDCTSLYQYAVKHLKLSEGCAFNLITVARKSVELPTLKQEIKAGTLSLTKARKLCSVIDAGNQAQWLDFAKTSSSKVLEREIARVNPKAGFLKSACRSCGACRIRNPNDSRSLWILRERCRQPWTCIWRGV